MSDVYVWFVGGSEMHAWYVVYVALCCHSSFRGGASVNGLSCLCTSLCFICVVLQRLYVCEHIEGRTFWLFGKPASTRVKFVLVSAGRGQNQ